MPSVNPDLVRGLLEDTVPEGALTDGEQRQRVKAYREQINGAAPAAASAALKRARKMGIDGTPKQADMQEPAFAVSVEQGLEEVRQALLGEFPEVESVESM